MATTASHRIVAPRPQPLAPPDGGERPFELVKYYSVTSLVIIMLFSLLVSTLMSKRASETVIKKTEQYAKVLAQSLNHQVLTRVIIPIWKEQRNQKNPHINLRDRRQYQRLDEVVRNTLHSYRDIVVRVSIMDLEGNVFYSTNPEYLSRAGYADRTFREALQKGQVNQVLPRPSFFDIGGGHRRVMRTLIPLHDEKVKTGEMGAPKGVFEILLDVSQDFNQVWLNQVLIVGTLAAMMALLFLILRLIVIRGQRISARQLEVQLALEEQLNQSERLAALGRMIAGVAHEIRNPLGIVRSTAELLGRRVEEPNRRLTGVIMEESTRLNQVVTEFMDFARPQSPQLEPLHVETVLRRNLRALAPEAHRLGVAVTERYQVPPVEVLADPDLLYRAFLNVFNNALQAMPSGGRLTVRTSLVQTDGRPMVQVAVEDTGPGFDPQAAAKVFDPFFTSKEQGTGLGLSIVSSIITGHQGEVEIGEAPGGGARVEMRLPAAAG